MTKRIELARVLIIEDMISLRDQCIEALRSLGVDGVYFEAASVDEAFEITEGEEIDIIFCDWNLEGDKEGIEFVKNRKDYPNLANVPLIMSTTESESSKILEAIQAGASEYLTKPWNSNDLEEKLNRVWKTFYS